MSPTDDRVRLSIPPTPHPPTPRLPPHKTATTSLCKSCHEDSLMLKTYTRTAMGKGEIWSIKFQITMRVQDERLQKLGKFVLYNEACQ